MTDPDERERVALLTGGRAGGEYLDGLGLTDLARLTDAQWHQFLRCVVGGYQEAVHGFTRATEGLPHDFDPPF